jgi:threonine/homoserine/homoserine lactone efflux protein
VEFWLKGLILGFSIAAPVGPIGLLCIQRTLDQGRRVGFVSGLGAASADAVYGSVAAFGLGAVFVWLGPWQTGLQIAGALFLIWLGIISIRKKIGIVQKKAQTISGLVSAYGSTFLLTLSNPATVLSFLAIFSGAGLAPTDSADMFSPSMMVAGVFCGSAFWWLVLSFSVSILRQHFLSNVRLMQWINRLAGLVLVLFGIVRILQVLMD